MDAITHILTGYAIGNLLAFNIYELMVCIIASAAMDLDIFIPRFFKYHRDFTHSFLFAFILSISLAGFSLIYHQAFLRIFSLALLCSSSHVLLDFSTTWGVPLLYPVKKQCSLELDTAVNPFLLIASLVLLVVMVISNSTLLSLSIFLLLMFYLSMRAISRYIVARKLDKNGEFAFIPTYSPFTWKVLHGWSNGQRYIQKTGFVCIFQSRYIELNTRAFPYSPFEIGRVAIAPPLESERSAILYSSSIEPVKSFTSKFKYTNAIAKLENGMWRVTWVSMEIGLQIELLISREGELVKISSSWQR
ncbi:MAG: metal-dependent hydrolase [Methanocellales archaeon]